MTMFLAKLVACWLVFQLAARRGALPSPFLMCHLNDHDNKVKGEQK